MGGAVAAETGFNPINGISQDPFMVEEEAPTSVLSSTHSRRRQGGSGTLPFMAVTAISLTLASGWIANLVVFLIEQFNIKSIDAAKIFNVVNGSFNFIPIIAAVLVDSFYGSFFVVIVSSILSLLGVILFTLLATIPSLKPQKCVTINGLMSCETPSTLQFAILYIAITLATLGLGGTRYTITTMGADQFSKPKDQASFINLYFFCFYVGAVASFTGIVYIQDNIGWGLGFGICVAANVLGLVSFSAGKRYYRHIKPEGSPFTSLGRVIVSTFRKWKMSASSSNINSFYNGDSIVGTTSQQQSSSQFPTLRFRFLNRAALKTEGDTNEDGSIAKPWRLCTVQQVEDFKTLIRLVPLWSSGIFISIPIGIQMALVVLQALTMDRHIGHHFQVPAGSFLVFTFISTAICIPIIDRFLLPTYQKLTQNTLVPLRRIGIGHVLNIVGMATSALVEARRLHVVRSHHLEKSSTSIAPMSAFWLVIPLAVVGAGEALHFPGQVEFYYKKFPASLRSTSTAMVSLLLAMGFYLSTAMINLVQRVTGWLPNNINDGRIDKMFWLLVVIGVVNFCYFITCSILYKYENVDDNIDENDIVDNHHQQKQED